MKSVTQMPDTLVVTDATIHGYARCSTNETKQDIDRQRRELTAAGATTIWTEFEHGDSATKSIQEMMLSAVKPGDTVVVTEVPRLARSTMQLCALISQIKSKRLRLQIIGSITIDCRGGTLDPMSAAFLQIAGVFAELELAMIRARVRSGMANAKAKGAAIGRPAITSENIPDIFFRYFCRYQAGDLNVSELARLCKVSRPTIYRWMKAVEGAQSE